MIGVTSEHLLEAKKTTNLAGMGIRTHSFSPLDFSAVDVTRSCSDAEKSNFVYHRRKQHKGSDDVSDAASGSSFLAKLENDHLTGSVRIRDSEDNIFMDDKDQQNAQPAVPSLQAIGSITTEDASNLSSAFGWSDGKVPNCVINRSSYDFCSSADDSCCSSKSDMEEIFLFPDGKKLNSGREFSSSNALLAEIFMENLFEELNASKRHRSRSAGVSDIGEITKDNCQSCKICSTLDNRQKLLLCDLCEEAFHLSCCNPPVKKLTSDEWFCGLCSKKKRKALHEITKKGGDEVSTHLQKMHIQSSLISLMLKDPEPHNSNVRIGEAFQADVQEWNGPFTGDTDDFGEATEISPSEHLKFDGCVSTHPSKNNSIGNWIQCRAVVYKRSEDGQQAVICGKWRRAPLFEVQSDDWECFCSILWDPTYADCAVPQELGTEEVMMQLKYIEMLKHRLASKEPKSLASNADSEQGETFVAQSLLGR